MAWSRIRVVISSLMLGWPVERARPGRQELVDLRGEVLGARAERGRWR